MTDYLTEIDLRSWIETFASTVLSDRDHLDKLDAATGDGEHGSNLGQGMSAVLALLERETFPDIRALFESIGMTVVNTVGGASGALYGTLFLRISDSGERRTDLGLEHLIQAFTSGMAGIEELGRCRPGDKTLLDALHPAVLALSSVQDAPLSVAVTRAAQAAAQGRDATATMQARRGRGSYLGERSLGHIDAGATSMAMLFEALRRTAKE